MPNPAVVRSVVEVTTRGALSLIAGEVVAARSRRPVEESPALKNAREQLLAEQAKLTRTETAVAVPDAAPFLADQGGAALAEQVTAAAATPLPPLVEGETHLGDALGAARRPTLPDKLFADIVGLDEAKRTLRTVVTSERQLHACLIGPPGSGKSALMEDLRTLPDSAYVIGQNVTAAGLIDLILGSRGVRVLLFDEIEKARPEALTTLLGMMTGKATRTVHGEHQEVDTDIRVVGACNAIEPLPAPLRSRMIELYLPEYSEAERKEVITGFLERRQGIPAAKAREVADLVAPVSADVRDAEQIAEIDKSDPALARQIAAGLRREPSEPTTRPRHRVTDKRAPRS